MEKSKIILKKHKKKEKHNETNSTRPVKVGIKCQIGKHQSNISHKNQEKQ